MSYPQESRINQQMDSQVKRTLARAIEYERTKTHFHKLMVTLQGIYANEDDRSVEGVEEFIEASLHSVSIGGPKYHGWKLEEWIKEQYNQ